MTKKKEHMSEAPCPIASLSVDAMVRRLSDAYVNLSRSDRPLRLMSSVMLWGPPGLGKSQGVRQLAAKVGEKAEKKTVVTDIRLLLFNPVDLRGIPVADADRAFAVWLKPKIFQMDEDKGTVNFLLLDEISAAPPSVQAAAYQLVLDRAIGEHKLPENCVVIAAGNRVSDRSVAWRMPLALANRLCHIEIVCDSISWRRWAAEKGIHPNIIAWIALRPDQLMRFDPESEALAFPTPRSWEMGSDLIYCLGGDVENAVALLRGLVGAGAAAEFSAFFRTCCDLPKMEDIFSGANPKTPERPDELYALTAAMLAYAREKRKDLEAIDHSIKYAMNLPPDFTFMLMNDYMAVDDDFKVNLLRNHTFAIWLNRNKRLL